MIDTQLYDLLGVRPTATSREIKFAYRLVAKTLHPDAGGDVEQFIALTRAFNVLIDPELRVYYDATGKFDAGSADDAHGEMLATLSKALDRVLSSTTIPIENTDIIKEMRRLVGTSDKLVSEELSVVEKKIASLGTVRKRIVRKDEAENLFVSVIDKQIRELSETQMNGRRAKKVIRRALDELDRYDSIVDVIRFVQSGLYASGPDAEQDGGNVVVTG